MSFKILKKKFSPMKVTNIDESKLIQLPKQTEKVIGEILLMNN